MTKMDIVDRLQPGDLSRIARDAKVIEDPRYSGLIPAPVLMMASMEFPLLADHGLVQLPDIQQGELHDRAVSAKAAYTHDADYAPRLTAVNVVADTGDNVVPLVVFSVSGPDNETALMAFAPYSNDDEFILVAFVMGHYNYVTDQTTIKHSAMNDPEMVRQTMTASVAAYLIGATTGAETQGKELENA